MCPSSTSSSSALARPVDGLIELEGGAVYERGRTAGLAFSSLFFLACTAGAGFLDIFRPVALPKLEGEERLEDERIRAEARILDGSQMTVWGRDVDQRSNVRRALVPAYTAALLRWFGETNEQVLVGRDGWLFLRSRAELPDSSTESVVRMGVRIVAAIDRRTASAGTELCILLVPRRPVLCAPFVPDWIDLRPDIDRAILRGMKDAGLRVVDLFEEFDEHRIEVLWWRRDTHWGRRGQLLAAEAACRTAGIAVPMDQRSSRLEPLEVEMDAKQGLLVFLGIKPQSWAARLLLPPDPSARLLRLEPSPEHLEGTGGLGLVGTSFSTDMLEEYLEHVADEPVDNGSKRGTQVIRTLTEFLRRHGENPLETIVVEIPVHQLFKGGLQADLEKFLRAHPPTRTTVLSTVSPEAPPTSPRRRRVVATLAPGRLTTTADGAVGLRLLGESGGRDLDLVLEVGRRRLSLPWTADLGELTLPVIHDSAAGADFRVLLVGEGAEAFRLDALQIVSELDVVERLDAPSVAVDAAGSWVASFRLSEPLRSTRRSALFLHLDSDSGFQGLIEILLSSADGSTRLLSTVRVHQRSDIQVALPQEESGPWTGVTVRGKGPVPRGSGAEVSFLDLHSGRR